jgi:membrane fusion protein, multidrug efflux system
LVQKDFITKSQYDEIVTGVETLKSTVRADEQATESARLQVERTSVTATGTGRAGAILVRNGAIIKANDTPLVTVNQIKPILVRFTVPEARLPEVQKFSGKATLPVKVSTSGEAGREFQGVLCFVDNAVDRTTGTVLLKARFDNADGLLWPGQFVDVTLVLDTDVHAVTVPAVAVQQGQEGLFVFVVKADLTVEKRTVEIKRSLDGTSVIGSGLKSGERVVTDGQLKLVPGSKVEIKPGQ